MKGELTLSEWRVKFELTLNRLCDKIEYRVVTMLLRGRIAGHLRWKPFADRQPAAQRHRANYGERNRARIHRSHQRARR